MRKWSTIKKLIWNRIATGAALISEKVTGTAPIILVNAVKKNLKSLTQYGLCIQNGTPSPDSPVDIVCNNGVLAVGPGINLFDLNQEFGYWMNSNGQIVENQNYRSTVMRCLPNTTYYMIHKSHFGSVYAFTVDDEEWTMESVISSSGGHYYNNVNIAESITTSENAKWMFVVWGSNDSHGAYYPPLDTQKDDFMLSTSKIIQAIPYEEYSFGFKVEGDDEYTHVIATLEKGYNAVECIEINNTSILTNVLGLDKRIVADVQYKNIRNQLDNFVNYARNSGTLAYAGPTRYCVNQTSTYSIFESPFVRRIIEIVFDKNTDTDKPRATLTIENDSVSITSSYSGTNGKLRFFSGSSTLKCWGIKIYDISTNELVFNGIPAIRTSDNVAGLYDSVTSTFITKEIETGTISIGSAASIENLLSVGEAKDEHNIVNGNIVRRVGHLVLDGTEKWNKFIYSVQQNYGYYYFRVDFSNNEAPICTHYIGVKNSDYVGISRIGVGNDHGYAGKCVKIGVDFNVYPTADDFKEFLAAQYANGTPVIVLYALDDEQTEQVEPQMLMLEEGNNTIYAVGNVSPIELEATYYKSKANPAESNIVGIGQAGYMII